ncbi:MAG: hypothetical protein IPH09_04910 [bacterium]|nr:hypothetical protein [bacterium]
MVRPPAIALLAGLCLAAPGAASGDAGPAAADTLAGLEHRYLIEADGSATLVVTAVLGEAGATDLLLPFGHAGADGFVVVRGDAAFPADAGGAPTAVRVAAGRRLLALRTGDAAAAGDTVTVRCRLARCVDWPQARGPFGAYDLTRTFVNDSGLAIGVFRLVLTLPPEYRIKRVTGTEPSFKPQDSPEPPYAVGQRDGRDTAALTAAPLRPGGRARLGLAAERSRRGAVPLVAGLLLAAAYLVFFRNLTKPAPPGSAKSPHKEDRA